MSVSWRAKSPNVGWPSNDKKHFRLNSMATLSISRTALIVEVKAVEKLIPIHDHQILTYMFFAKCPTGLLLNFHAFPFAEKGIKRFKL